MADKTADAILKIFCLFSFGSFLTVLVLWPVTTLIIAGVFICIGAVLWAFAHTITNFDG